MHVLRQDMQVFKQHLETLAAVLKDADGLLHARSSEIRKLPEPFHVLVYLGHVQRRSLRCAFFAQCPQVSGSRTKDHRTCWPCMPSVVMEDKPSLLRLRRGHSGTQVYNCHDACMAREFSVLQRVKCTLGLAMMLARL